MEPMKAPAAESPANLKKQRAGPPKEGETTAAEELGLSDGLVSSSASDDSSFEESAMAAILYLPPSLSALLNPFPIS
ncbi:hypothetical protein SDJN03_25071, partial [Cucurbita argyrosperma subsp. sororia]